MLIMKRLNMTRALGVAVTLSVSFFAVDEVSAQARWEVAVAVGSQTYLNDIEPDPGSAGAYALGVIWQWQGPHHVWARYASATYEVSFLDGSTKDESVGNMLAGYRYTFQHEKPLHPYVEIGIGTSDPIIGFETGAKSAGTAAIGLQWVRWRAGKTGVFAEYRSVAWDQDDTADVAEVLLGVEGEDTGIQSAEFMLGLVARF